MNKEELIVELEDNYVRVNIDDTRISYCNSLDKELAKAIYNLQQKLNQKNEIIEEIEEYCKDTLENKYCGCDSYINGKNEGVEETAQSILKILKKGSEDSE